MFPSDGLKRSVLRSSARRLRSQAIEAEAEAFLAMMKGEQLPNGRDRLVGQPPCSGARGIGPIEEQAECMLALIGATLEGRILGFQVGVRKSAQSWRGAADRP